MSRTIITVLILVIANILFGEPVPPPIVIDVPPMPPMVTIPPPPPPIKLEIPDLPDTSKGLPKFKGESPRVKMPERIKERYENLGNDFNDRLGLEKFRDMMQPATDKPVNPPLDSQQNIAQATTASKNSKIKSYEPISPFNAEYESPAYGIQRIYESLPLIANPQNQADITGTADLVNTHANQLIAGKKSSYPHNFEQIQPIGKRDIEVRIHNSNKTYYWFVYGRTEFFYRQSYSTQKPQKSIANYVIIMHFKKGNAQPYTDFLRIADINFVDDKQTLDSISVEAATLKQKANERAFNTVPQKTSWTISNKTEALTFGSYKAGKANFKTPNGAIRSVNPKQLSHEEQLLLRGYLDHQGLSVR